MGRASYTTAAEDAAKIRAAYKARGWNARHVSVLLALGLRERARAA